MVVAQWLPSVKWRNGGGVRASARPPMGAKATRNPIARLSAGLAIRFLLVFILLNSLFLPFILNIARDRAVRIIHNYAVIVYQLVDEERGLTPHLRQALAHFDELRGVVYTDPMSRKRHILWFSGQRDELDMKPITDIDHDNLWHGLADVWRAVNAPPMNVAVAYKYDMPSNLYLGVIYQQDMIHQDLLAMTRYFFLSVLLVSLIFTFLMHILFSRQLPISLADLLAELYQNALEKKPPIKDAAKGGAKEATSDLQSRIAVHISEQSRLASLGAGAARLTHDIRNLLSSLQLFSDRLSASAQNEERKMGERISIIIARVTNLCEWTMLYASTAQKQITRHRQPLHALVDEVLTLVRLHDVNQRVQLINQIAPQAYIDCERMLAFRIIYNIVLNAIQAIHASGENGWVKVASADKNGGTLITITDNGPGMDAAIVETLFAPYESGAKSQSTGLGMAIAYELAEWHNGHLTLKYTNASGTCFELYLPDDEAA